jgi:hypothetical protein
VRYICTAQWNPPLLPCPSSNSAVAVSKLELTRYSTVRTYCTARHNSHLLCSRAIKPSPLDVNRALSLSSSTPFQSPLLCSPVRPEGLRISLDAAPPVARSQRLPLRLRLGQGTKQAEQRLARLHEQGYTGQQGGAQLCSPDVDRHC